jgi:hypothetical protein
VPEIQKGPALIFKRDRSVRKGTCTRFGQVGRGSRCGPTKGASSSCDWCLADVKRPPTEAAKIQGMKP